MIKVADRDLSNRGPVSEAAFIARIETMATCLLRRCCDRHRMRHPRNVQRKSHKNGTARKHCYESTANLFSEEGSNIRRDTA